MAAFSHQLPLIGGEKVLQIKACAEVRREVANPPKWSACLTKAFGIVSSRIPELRRSYLGFPFPRFYEHPESVASIVVNRNFSGEPAVFPGLLQGPEKLSLAQIDSTIRDFQERPFHEIGCFRRLIRTSRFPLPVRRLLWWYGLCVSGKQKSKVFGTFAINSFARSSFRITHFMSPITSMFYYGPSGIFGEMVIQLVFDHRVFDGSTAVHGLQELENILNEEVAQEIAECSRGGN